MMEDTRRGAAKTAEMWVFASGHTKRQQVAFPRPVDSGLISDSSKCGCITHSSFRSRSCGRTLLWYKSHALNVCFGSCSTLATNKVAVCHLSAFGSQNGPSK